VSGLAPTALATSFNPPRLIARAAAPSSSRHCRSSSGRPDLRQPGRQRSWPCAV